jgi:AcrR family transcriptional regulator
VAKAIVDERGPDGVTMGTVAERAEVTRALVYKHFENRESLLLALYRREARALDHHIRRRVEAAEGGFEPKLRAFVGACLDAVGEHGRFFTPLRSLGGNPSAREQQRRRDRRTTRYFAALAVEEYGIDERTAASAIGVLFSGIQALLSQMRHRPGEPQRQRLETLYVEMTIGALGRLAEVTAQPATAGRR